MSNYKRIGKLTTNNVLECTTEWKIPNFRNVSGNRRNLKSPSFPLVTAKDSIEWQLVLYPDKYYVTQGHRRDCIGLYLDAYCEDREVRFSLVSAEFCLVTNEGEEVETKHLKRLNVNTGHENHLGIANFIPWRVLLAKQQLLLTNGTLTVVCRIKTELDSNGTCDLRRLNSAMSSTTSLISLDDTASTSSDPKLEALFKWKSEPITTKFEREEPDQKFAAYFKSETKTNTDKTEREIMDLNPSVSNADDLDYASRLTSRLLDMSICADVVLTCSGKSFKCHKNILASKSPVFLKMFAGDIKPVTLDLSDDLTPMAVEDLLSYFYTGRVRHLSENSLLLFTAALEYEVSELKDMTKKEIVSKLTPEKAVDLLLFAQKSGAKELKKLAAEYIANS